MLRIRYLGGPGPAAGGLQAAVLALALLGLVPLPDLRRRVAVPAPPQPSRPVPREPQAVDVVLPHPPQVFGADHPEQGAVTPLFSDPTDPITQLDQPGQVDQVDQVVQLVPVEHSSPERGS